MGRWSKPHVSITYLHSLQVIYDHIKSGTAVLELDLQGMDGSKQKLAGRRQHSNYNHNFMRISRQYIMANGTMFYVIYCACVTDVVVSKLRKEKNLSEDACNQLRGILVGPHKHAHRVKDKVKGDRSSEFRQGSDNNVNGDGELTVTGVKIHVRL